MKKVYFILISLVVVIILGYVLFMSNYLKQSPETTPPPSNTTSESTQNQQQASPDNTAKIENGNKPQTEATSELPKETKPDSDTQPKPAENSDQKVENFISIEVTGEPIKVEWKDPEEVNDLNLGSDSYYKVGKVTEGKYKDGEVIIASSVVMLSSDFYYIIDVNQKYVMIEKASADLYDNNGLDRSKLILDKESTFPDLVFPEKISNNGILFALQPERNNIFFNNLGELSLAFTDPKIGKVYKDNSSDTRNGYYVKAPDGSVRTYALVINFYNDNKNIPSVTWADGTTNTTEYVYTDISGCGSSNYLSIQRSITLNDLVRAGKTSTGDAVYFLKNSDSQILKDIYEKQYYDYSGEGKMSYANFIASRPVFFWVDPFGSIVKFQSAKFVPQVECGKPVIYLYPQETMSVSVKVSPEGGFTKTDPEYNDGWNVLTTPNSLITDLNTGKTYPYLFWEGRGGIYKMPQKGFVVAGTDVHNFLVEKLTLLGLNSIEQKDFLEFWEPRIVGSPYFFITFLGNQEMNRLAPLDISPKPDTVIRILMDFKPLDKPMDVEGFDIKTPTRKGFTVVEWGGVINK